MFGAPEPAIPRQRAATTDPVAEFAVSGCPDPVRGKTHHDAASTGGGWVHPDRWVGEAEWVSPFHDECGRETERRDQRGGQAPRFTHERDRTTLRPDDPDTDPANLRTNLVTV